MCIVIWSPLHLIEPLLADAGLPIDDIDSPNIRWIVATEENRHALSEGSRRRRRRDEETAAPIAPRVVGCGGLQWLDATTALVRSLAVASERRGEGIGAALHDRLVDEARGTGIKDLYLLTTTAAAWFARRGWIALDRAEAPEIVRSTRQFADLCPDTALVMRYTDPL